MSETYVQGLVSVVMPTYKRSEMLKRAIMSVLEQSYNELELLVVNDNVKGDEYSENLYNLLNSINDPRLHLVEQECHINGAAARNAGIRKAKGEYIAFLDDDDLWDSKKIEIQVNELKKLDSTWGGVSCLKKYYRNDEFYRASLPYKDGYIFESVLTFLTDITTGTILMKREALDNAGYFDETLMRAQDIQLFAYFTKKYKIKLVKQHLLLIDASDAQNRPPIEKLEQLRQKYAKSVDGLLDDKPELKRKLQLHIQCSKGIALIRNRNLYLGCKNIVRTLANPTVFLGQCKLYIIKIIETILRNKIQKYYSS